MTKEKLITVIVPSYNHEKYVQECIDSIASQTFRDFQWIIVDDCSKDRTPGILLENQEKYGYQLILRKKNIGLSASVTDILENYAKGKYIAFCASDDYWVPNKLELQLNFMENNPQYAMCFGKCFVVDSNSKVINKKSNPFLRGGWIFDDIITMKFHPPVNYLYRFSVLKECGFFSSGIIAEDFYMNCLISSRYEIGYLPIELIYYRDAPLSSKRDPYALYLSQRETIELFKNCSIYPKAISLQSFREFLGLSSYKKYKFIALKALLKTRWNSINLHDTLAGLYYMFFKWNI